jgi:LysR family transcriptional regulator, transcriptional activator of the cysJI operon
MDFSLKVFLSVVRTNNFTRASELLNITQPAVTSQIKKLESALNAKLFFRVGNKISLTDAGRILFKHANEIEHIYRVALKEILEMSSRVAGDIQFGATSLMAKYFLPCAIGEFKRLYPDTNLSMLVGNSNEIRQFLKKDVIEFGIVSEPLEPIDFMHVHLFRDTLTVIVHPKHPWWRKKEVTVADLFKEDFISREAGSGTRKLYTKCIESASKGRELKTFMVLGSTEAVKRAVIAGYGFTIISKLSCEMESKEGLLREIPVRDLPMKRDFFLLFKAGERMSIAALKFKEYLEKENNVKTDYQMAE